MRATDRQRQRYKEGGDREKGLGLEGERQTQTEKDRRTDRQTDR